MTGISSGSFLASHNGPSYSSGTTGHRYYNGNTMMLACWTTGDGDADGHGDHYWFALDFDSDSGYINDWYVTTAVPSRVQTVACNSGHVRRSCCCSGSSPYSPCRCTP